MRRWNWAASSAAITFVLTLVTFVVAVTTLPFSGPFCVSECLDYPYREAVTRFPRDYYWMALACLLYLGFVVLLAHVLDRAPAGRRVPAVLALTFGAMSATVLISDYVIQLSVIQPSLLKGEVEGIALLSQFNPHGLFIALEELGYVLMALAMALAASALEADRPVLRIAKMALCAALPLSVFAFAVVTVIYGIDREYRFEVAVISITWLLMLPASAAMTLGYRTRAELGAS
jgi:hypothetical protein